MRVLVVDDFPLAADASCLLLEVLGHECRKARDGATALVELPTFAPEAVLLDRHLPDLDGYEVARRIRAASAQPVRIVLMTGDATIDAAELPDGIDALIIKPPTLAALRHAFAS